MTTDQSKKKKKDKSVIKGSNYDVEEHELYNVHATEWMKISGNVKSEKIKNRGDQWAQKGLNEWVIVALARQGHAFDDKGWPINRRGRSRLS